MNWQIGARPYKKFKFNIVLCIVGAVNLSIITACSIQPTPENVTGVSTYQIVQHIRCEMRDTLRSYVIGAMDKFGQSKLARELKENPELFAGFDQRMRSGFSKDLQDILNRYDHGYIGYEFTFDMTEQNILDGGLSFGKLFTNGAFSASVGGKADKKRNNVRNFVVIDNNENLVRFLNKDNRKKEICSNNSSGVNFAYPISGSLNLSNSFGQFVNLYEFGNLKAKEGDSVWNDTMEFTTAFSGELGGSLTLSPLTEHIRLTEAKLKQSSLRIDKHKLALTFVLSKEVDLRGNPLSASAQNARARELARLELECQRVRNDTNSNLVVPCIPSRLADGFQF
ncbi:hypothetical protein [Labrenzia sp. PHM005]|uniref:hypothetical protein n=1 Tax=Labrenzia sp. PHM005 TaxID=2590016 RepID=UPI001140391D|nr:hypothetical protein [Labrenzia sp. PHM005]QDG78656.1 hypothetical protein FJ695_23860 [Labrenzia sp. PHM005]